MNNKESNSISKIEQESHMRILEQSVFEDEFKGIFEHSSFEEPAIVMSFKKMPSKTYFNMLVNTLKIRRDEGDIKEDENYLYLHLKSEGGKGLKIGLVRKHLDNVFLMEELLKRFNVDLLEINNGSVKKLEYLNYITTMEL